MNMGCMVLRPGMNPNCSAGSNLCAMHQAVSTCRNTLAYRRYNTLLTASILYLLGSCIVHRIVDLVSHAKQWAVKVVEEGCPRLAMGVVAAFQRRAEKHYSPVYSAAFVLDPANYKSLAPGTHPRPPLHVLTASQLQDVTATVARLSDCDEEDVDWELKKLKLAHWPDAMASDVKSIVAQTRTDEDGRTVAACAATCGALRRERLSPAVPRLLDASYPCMSPRPQQSETGRIRFYDQDVSAALNIRRIAAGPGRPRELSSWLGRPAMPNPGRPGQEWVLMPGSKKLGNGLAGKSQASKAQSDSSESRPRPGPECPGVEQAAKAMEALQTTDPKKLEVGAQDNTVSSLTQPPAAGGSATCMGPIGGTASGAITARLPPLVSPHHHSRPAAPAGAIAAPEPTVGQLQMQMVSLQSKLQTEQVAVIKLRARVAQLEPLEHTRLMRERFTSATAQLQTASGDLVRVTARLQELLSLPFLTAEQAEEQAKASAMHTSLRQDIARLTAEVNSCATAATATGAAELDAAANELAAAQRQTQLERTLRERAQEELRTGNAHNQARCRELEGQIESLKHNYNVVQGDKAALQDKLNSFESRLRNARTILSQFPGGVEAMLNRHLHELSAPEQARAQKASLHRNFNENVLFSFMATSEAAGANPSLPSAAGAPGPSNAVPPLPPPITEDEELWQEDAFTADELEAGPGLYMGPKEHEAVQAWFATGPANRLRHYLEYAASMKLGDLANHHNWGPSACGLHFHEWAQCVKPLFAEKVSTKDVVEQTPSLPAVPQQTQDTRPLSIKPKHPPPFSGADKQIWEDFKFQFESYLDTCRVPKQDWPDHVLNMLEGKALQAWLAVAQPMRALGTKPTWENLADTMAKSFVHINIPVEARKALYSIKQQTRTSEYLRHFRLLLARVTEPKPADADLLNFYYTGLKQTLRDQCKLNPKTGRFWDNFEELADFTLQIDLHSRIASALQAHLPVRTVAVVPVAAAAAAAPEAEAVPVDVEIIPVSTTTTTRTTTVEAVVAAVAAARDGAVMITAPDNPGQQDI
ncbi:hypothetical protein QJQ45_011625 [Haematococcus lacustris]|nr:hypothetical protein QJQ45_011625 [Haematococcus lacustris]